MESLDQCVSTQNGEIILESIVCIRKICERLQTMCEGKDIEEIVETVNKVYVNLENSDYLGKSTIMSWMVLSILQKSF